MLLRGVLSPTFGASFDFGFATYVPVLDKNVEENWFGIIIYYHELQKNAEAFKKIMNNIGNFTKQGLQMAYLTAILIQPPAQQDMQQYRDIWTTDNDNEDIIYQIENQNNYEDWFPDDQSFQNKPRVNEPNTQKKEKNSDSKWEQSPEAGEPQNPFSRRHNIDVLKTDEACLKYGEYALTCPTIIHDDVIDAIVQEYRKNDKHANEIAHWIKVYAKEFGINAEVAMTAFMLQESSFGKVTGNLSGKYNIGNIRGKNGKFVNYRSYQEGVYAIFWQLDRYYRVWEIGGEKNAINNLETALHVFAPPYENPTNERIKIAKEFIDSIRALSDQYEQGKIQKEDIQREIYKIRQQLQQRYGPTWV